VFVASFAAIADAIVDAVTGEWELTVEADSHPVFFFRRQMLLNRVTHFALENLLRLNLSDIIFKAEFFKEGLNESNAATVIAGQLRISKPLHNESRERFTSWGFPHDLAQVPVFHIQRLM